MTPDTLLQARPFLSVAHHVPGRLRIRFAPALVKEMPELADGDGLQALERVNGVKKVDLRPLSTSLVIDYDPRVLSPESWQTILTGPEDGARRILEQYMGG